MLHREELESIPNDADRAKRMTELHVMEGNNTAAVRSPPTKSLLTPSIVWLGVYNVCRTSIIKDAWERRKSANVFPHVHGWVYGLHDGFVRGKRGPFAFFTWPARVLNNLAYVRVSLHRKTST